MEEQKLERKFTYNRSELASLFATIAKSIPSGKMNIAGEEVVLPTGKSMMEIEFKSEEDEGKLEIQIKWK